MKNSYRYSGRDWNGRAVRGEIAAASRTEALELLKLRALVITALQEEQVRNARAVEAFRKALHLTGYRPYNNRLLMIFCSQFSTMLQAGICLLPCLKILANQTELAPLKNALHRTTRIVEEGGSLAAAMQSEPYNFPPLLIAMVETGESGGKLDAVMEKMAEHYERQHDLQEKLRSATLYPLIIIIAALAVMVVMITYVLPQFAQTFSSMGMELPLFSKLLLQAGTLASRFRLLLLVLAPAVLLASTWAIQTKRGRRGLDRLRLHLPLIGKIYRHNMAARYARTMSALLSGGVTLFEALQLSDRVIGNHYISLSIVTVGDALSRGETMAAAMQNSPYFPALLIEMTRIGEETGTLDQTLNRTAHFYEREVSYFVDRLGTVIEPLLLLSVGLFIGLLVYSILSPMYRVFEMI